MDFIDLCGASGAIYRFRRWPAAGPHPPIAGNWALVAKGAGTVLALRVVEDLSLAGSALADAQEGAELYTRLNISRRVREAEHADLALEHPGAAFGASGALFRMEERHHLQGNPLID